MKVNLNPPLPFETVLNGFLTVAEARLKGRLADRALPGYLDETALAGLKSHLLNRILRVSSQLLDLEFNAYRISHRLRAIDSPPVGIYQNFISALQQGRLAELAQAYPGWRVTLEIIVDQWVETVAEFLERLSADWQAIEQFLPGRHPLRRVSKIVPGLSDPHRQGRTVLQLCFDDRHHLIYKPRPAGLEKALGNFLEWLNNNAGTSFKPLKHLNRGEYSWVERVAHRPVADIGEVQQFYHRAGALIAVGYLLNARDCHCENIIAAGAFPVLIDGECLLQPAGNAAATVQDSGLLPNWLPAGAFRYDIGGLSGTGAALPLPPEFAWEHINSDKMTLGNGRRIANRPANRPFLDNGKLMTASDFMNDILEGFRETYQAILYLRPQLQRAQGPLSEFAGQMTRIVLRPTLDYISVLRKRMLPERLKQPLKRCAPLSAVNSAPAALIRQYEYRAIARRDIPVFMANSSGRTLYSGDCSLFIEDYFAESGYERLQRRLQHFSKMDLERQLKAIRVAFLT